MFRDFLFPIYEVSFCFYLSKAFLAGTAHVNQGCPPLPFPSSYRVLLRFAMSDDLLASEDPLAFDEVGQNVAGFLKNGPPEPQAFVAAVLNEERRVRDRFDSFSLYVYLQTNNETH